MTTKLLFTFLSITFFSISYSQQEATSYISGLDEPSAMVNKGNLLYVQGPKELYEIDTASGSPTANVVYTPALNFYMTNLTISGDIIYISEENYDPVANQAFGCRIIAFDTNNPGNGVTEIYSTLQYVSSLAIKGSTIYFTEEAETAPDVFTVQVQKIDINNLLGGATIVVSNLAEDEEANDMAFYSNNLMISVGGEGKVFGFDITDSVITVTEYLNALNFNKGFFVNGNKLFIAEAHLIGTKPLNSPASLTYVAQNTFYKDNNNGAYDANFRDVVLIGDKLYMTLLNQGRVVTVQDASLDTKDFNQNLKSVTVSNTKTELTVSGLEDYHNAIVYNLAGQQIASKELSVSDSTINLSSLSNGVYVLNLDNQKTFKFIK